MQLSEGAQLQGGKYSIIRTLGQGGFGITYEAEQVALHRRVAIKEFFMKEYCDRDSTTSHVTLGISEGNKGLVEQFREKFVREARMIAGFDNPHIIKIYDIFEENGTAYYVMPYLDGGSLAEKVKKEGPLNEEQAIKYIKQVSNALDYIHKQNILHLDVKPSNVLLNTADEAVLIDFGISKHYDEAGSQTSTTPVGISKGFAPIEQYQQGNVSLFSPATDIYSLGATLFFLLTGKIPPEAMELLEKMLPTFNGSPKIQHAIKVAMAPRRIDRPQSIDSFLSQLSSSVSSISNPEPFPYQAEETTVLINDPLKSSIQNLPQAVPILHKKQEGGHSAGAIAGLIGAIAIIVLIVVLVPNISTHGDEGQSITNTQPASSQSGNVTNDSMVQLPNKCQLSGSLVLGGKSIHVRFEVDFSNRTGNSYYSTTPLPLTISEIAAYSDHAEFLMTERNPNRTSISNNALGGNTTAIYRCRLNKNGSVSGTGKNYKGQDFTFSLTSN